MATKWHIVAIAVIAALIGGVGGASLMNTKSGQADDSATMATSRSVTTPAQAALTNEQIELVARVAAETALETAREDGMVQAKRASSPVRGQRSSRRVYYDYNGQPSSQPAAYAPQKRSFWSRHRDILTVGIGTALGTAIGAGAGGKKGALIGAGVGAGGSALYTYGLRDRSRNY